MPPKTPSELKEQLEKQNAETPADGVERSSEGIELPAPKRGDFFANLKTLSQPSEDSE